MVRQTLRQVLKQVDPDLKVAIKSHGYRGHSSTDWKAAAGVICSQCGREVYRSRDGLCFPCWDQKHEIEVRDGTGILNWLPDTILQQITHQARKE